MTEHFNPAASRSGPTRRGFLIQSGVAATTISMGYGLLSAGSASAAGGMISPNMFFDIHADGRVVFHCAKAEMGQHVGTALAQVLVEELQCDWDAVELSYVGFDPRHGLHLTGGSWSVNWTFDALSRAGAAGRIALVEAAAAKLGGKPGDYTVAKGVISGGGKSITYAELAAAGVETRAFSEEDLKTVPLKPAAERTLIGQEVQALDIPDKVRGKANYGIDVVLDGMVYATPKAPPVRYGATVKSVDDSAARAIAGYQSHVVIEDPLGTHTGLVVAVADSYWTAKQAAEALKIDYDLGPNATVSFADVQAEGRRLVKTEEAARIVLKDGDAAGALASAEKTLSAEYTTGVNIHAPLEPMNAAVEIKDGVYHIYAGNQFQTLMTGLVGALGVEPDKIVHHQQLLGGGFGRRLDADYVVLACHTAKAVGKPVKVIWSREADMQLDFTRPAAVVQMTAGLKGGAIAAWKSSSASAWASARQAPAFLTPDLSGDENNKYDGFAVNGADHWYSIPNQSVLLSLNETAQSALPPGHLRAVGPGWQFWAVESFMDEVAHELGEDPLALRLRLLDGAGKNAGEGATTGGAKRLAAVLEDVAKRAGYGSPRAGGTGLGIACVSSQERGSASWTACAAEVSVDLSSGAFRVDKLTLGMDVGTAVNPNGVKAQIAGSAMWGLSIATLEQATLEDGAIDAMNFDSYTPARMSNLPEFDIALLPTANYPTGCGEPGTTVVAPAIANAIFNASGARVRSLPITAEKVAAAMKA